MSRLVVFVIFAPFLFVAAQHFKLYSEPDTNTAAYHNRFQNNREGVSYRLTNDTVPLHYDISLHTRIDVPTFDFNGIVTIRLRVVTATRTITLHSKQQVIISALLTNSAGQSIVTRPPFQDPMTEFLQITTESQDLVVGDEYTLTIAYSSTLRTDDEGFYRSSYMGDNGERIWQAATQFQESDARHGFPCYDEPAIRTTFSIRITHGENYHALSNMPARDIITNTDQTKTTYFEDTPSMQTYLVAFLVSDFIFISNADTKQPNELLQSVYGQPRAIRNGEADFALEAGIKIMHKMEEYFGFPYTLPKIDQVGVPDFSAGAMENWGLAKYREMLLYYDNGTSPFQQLDWVGTIISHEYAHQWFGNLISPRWWDVLWINEGFATMYEYLSTDAVYPEWRIHDLMVVGTLQTVMERDALPSSRPMTYYVESQEDVRNLFDFVAYSKSGCVLRMLQHIMTDAAFRKGLTYYIEDMQYKTAEPDDLYRNLLIAAREDNVIPATVTIKQIMDSWAEQMGFPMIRVSREQNGAITIVQAHFLLQGSVPNEQTWWIPINFATKSQPDFSQTTPMHWLPQGETSITLTTTPNMPWTTEDWLVFNKHQTGYYRVNYDETLWQQIVDELVAGNYSTIPVINRAQLIDDAYTFARVKQVPYSTVFSLLEYLSHELDYAPWAPTSRALFAIDRRIASWENYHHFKTFVHNKVQPLFESLGVQNNANDTYFDRLARNVAIRWACYVGSDECLEATNERLKAVIQTGAVIETDVRSTIFCNGLRQADEADYLAIWVRLTSTSSQADRNMLIDSLGCSQNFELVSTFLVSTTSSTNVDYSTAERIRILNAAIQGGIVGVRAVLQFLDTNLLQVIAMYPVDGVVNNLAPWIGNEQLMTQFTELTTRILIAGQITNEARNNAIQTAQANLQWALDHGADINEWLNLYIDRSNGGASVQILSGLLSLTTLVSFINLYQLR